jgi:hypothetical protein
MDAVLREGLLIAGFLMKFIKVRASRGKLVLVKVKSSTDHYFRAGAISEKALKYKARGQKEKKTIPYTTDEGGLYRAMTVYCIDVDEDKNSIIKTDGKEIDTYDAEKYEQLITRALYKPVLMDKNDKIILLLIIVAILGILILFFFVKGIDDRTLLMAEQLTKLKEISSAAVIG